MSKTGPERSRRAIEAAYREQYGERWKARSALPLTTIALVTWSVTTLLWITDALISGQTWAWAAAAAGVANVGLFGTRWRRDRRAQGSAHGDASAGVHGP